MVNIKNNLLKEIADFFSFLKTPKTEKEIVFYSEHEGYYPYLEGIIKELIKHKKVCYITSNSNDPILQKPEFEIKTFYLNRLLPILMATVNCKVFVMTLTDLNQYHLKRSFNPVHYVYVFHAVVSTHMIYRRGSFDHYDSILCVGPHQIEEIEKYEKLNKLPAKKLIKTGYYRLERIYEAYKKEKKRKKKKDKFRTILIAPSWGEDNILESCGEALIELLLKDYKVIVRPHPETVKHSPKLLDLFSSKFSNNPNFILEKSIATDDSLLRADVLITDYSGISLEYAFGTERPVLFLDVPPKVHNQKFSELNIEPLELFIRPKIGVVVSPKKIETIPKVISNLITNNADYKKDIIKLRKKYIYNFGHSSEVGAKHIIDLLKSKN